MAILLAFCEYRANSFGRNSTNIFRPVHTLSIKADAHSPGIMSLDQSVGDSHSHLDEPPFKMLEWVKDTDDLV